MLPNLHAIVYEEIDALPDHDDGEVQDVPGIPQVGVLMLEEALGNDLHDTLGSEDEEEDIFNFFLKKIRMNLFCLKTTHSFSTFLLKRQF